MAAKIKKGDFVRVMRGRDAGKEGKVIKVDPKRQRVWVEKVNIISRHRKARLEGEESQIEKKEAPIHISNVMLIDPETKEPTRVGFKFVYDVSEEEKKRLEAEGKPVPKRKVRYAKKSGAILE